MKVAFDIHGCILNHNNSPNYELINVLKWFHSNGDEIFVWSGSGPEFAKDICIRLGLSDLVNILQKTKDEPMDIAFDDRPGEVTSIINILVKQNKQ